MSVPLYMDQHVRAEMTDGRRLRGVDVRTAFEDGAANWDDDFLFDRAIQFGRVLLSQDRDLLTLAHCWQRTGRDFAGLVQAQQNAITIGQAIRDLEAIATVDDSDNIVWNRVEFRPYP